MGRSKQKLVLRVLAVAAMWASGVHAHAQDLGTLYEMAKQHDAQFQAASFAWEAAQQRSPQARAALLPRLSYSQSRGKERGTLELGEEEPVDKSIDSRDRSLQLTQGIIRPEQWMAFRQANAQEAHALLQYKAAQQELIVRVVQAYLDAWLASENQRLSHLQLKAVQAQLALAKRNFDVGSSTITDVYEAQAKLDLSMAQSFAAGTELSVKLADIERIVGVRPSQLHGLVTDAAPPTAQLGGTGPWIDRATSQALSVLTAQAALASVNAEEDRHRAGFLPTLDLSVSKGTSRNSGSFNSPTDLATRTSSTKTHLTLNWTLFEGGSNYYRVKETAALLSKAEADLDFAKRQTASSVRQAMAALRNAQAQLGALASGLQSSRKALEASRVGYRIGTRINLDVLNAESQVFAVERDLAKTRVDALMQWVRLLAASGELQETTIAQIAAQMETRPFDVPSDDVTDTAQSEPGVRTNALSQSSKPTQ